MSENPVSENFLLFASSRMQISARDIFACCDRLSEDQMWHRSGNYENSVANLLLHLEGNLRQWVMHGIDGQPDVRQRDDEFTLSPSTTAAEARALFQAAIDEAVRIITTLPPHRLLDVIDPQPNGTWRNLTVLQAIFQVTAHVQQHMGQIMLLTKQLTQNDLDLSMPRKR